MTVVIPLMLAMHTEILTKAMGREISGRGTWDAGLKVILDFAGRNGVRRRLSGGRSGAA